jgi:hypothetical protein
MAEQRKGLMLHGDRWYPEGDLERLRRTAELEDDPEATERYGRAQARRGMLCLAKSALAIVRPGSWRLPKNNIWNVPDGTDSVPFEYKHFGPWSIVSSLRGIAVDRNGCVYGPRSLSQPKQMGHQMHGRVSIGGKQYPAWTSSQLFERPNGSLVDVGILWVVTPNKNPFADW